MFDSSKFTKSLKDCKANKFNKPGKSAKSSPLATACLGALMGLILMTLIGFNYVDNAYSNVKRIGKERSIAKFSDNYAGYPLAGAVLGFLVFGAVGLIRSSFDPKISGSIVIDQSDLQQQLTPDPQVLPRSPLNLVGVKLPTSAEQFPLLILGADEVGKSVLISNLLEALILREQQWQAIVIYRQEESDNDSSDLIWQISESPASVLINASEIANGNLTTMSLAQLAVSHGNDPKWVLMPFSEASSDQYSQAYALVLEALNQALRTPVCSCHKKIALVLKGAELLSIRQLQAIIAQVQRMDGLVIVASESIAPLTQLFYPKAWHVLQEAIKLILNYQDNSTIEELCRTIGTQKYRERIVTCHNIYYRGHYGIASSVKHNYHTRYAIAPDQLRSLHPRQAYLKVGKLNPTGIGF